MEVSAVWGEKYESIWQTADHLNVFYMLDFIKLSELSKNMKGTQFKNTDEELLSLQIIIFR